MTVLSSRALKWQVASAIVMATIIAGCHDDRAVGPQESRGPLGPIRADYQPGQNLGNYEPPVPPENNVLYSWQNTHIPIPAGVIERISVTGFLHFNANPAFTTCSQQSVPPLPGGSDPGPAGMDGAHQYAVIIGLGGESTEPSSNLGTLQPQQASADSVSIVISGSGVLWVSRPSVVYSNCTSQATGYQPAYFVSGTQTLNVTVLAPPVITLDKSTVVAGDTVTAQVQANWTTDLLPWYWAWVQDSPNGGPAPVVSGCGWGNTTCKVLVQGNGHLEIPSLRVNQTIWTAVSSPAIHVVPPQLKVTASPQSVADSGQITFVATVTPSTNWSISSWQWVPDTGSGGISPNNCQVSEKTCTRAVSTSGWMKVTATVGQYTLSDSTHVNVVRCLTNKKGLDDTGVRQALISGWQWSSSNQLERHFLVLYDSLTNQYSVSQMSIDSGSVCRSYWHIPNPAAYPGKKVVAIEHAHPLHAGNSFFCPSTPSSSLGTWQYAGEGGSPFDWAAFKTILADPNWQAAGWTDFGFWVMDGDNLYVMEPGKSPGSELKKNKTKFKWSGGQCSW